MHGTAGADHRLEQCGFIPAGCLADDEASVVQGLDEAGQRFGRVVEAPASSGATVKGDDFRLADVAADEGGGRERGHCDTLRNFRLSAGRRSPFNPPSVANSGQRTMMTAGSMPNRETVALATRRAGGWTGTAHPAGAEPSLYRQAARDNREPMRSSGVAIHAGEAEPLAWIASALRASR